MWRARKIAELKQKILAEQKELEDLRMQYRNVLDSLAHPVQEELYGRDVEKVQAEARERECEKVFHEAERKLERADEVVRQSQREVDEKAQELSQKKDEEESIEDQIRQLQ